MKGDASWSQLHRNLETPSQKQNFGNTNPTPSPQNPNNPVYPVMG